MGLARQAGEKGKPCQSALQRRLGSSTLKLTSLAVVAVGDDANGAKIGANPPSSCIRYRAARLQDADVVQGRRKKKGEEEGRWDSGEARRRARENKAPRRPDQSNKSRMAMEQRGVLEVKLVATGGPSVRLAG